MKKLLILGAAVLFISSSFAQESKTEDQSRKIEHIMELIDVDKVTAQKTADLLDEFKEQKKMAHESRKSEKEYNRENLDNMSDDEIEKIHREKFNDQRAMIDLDEDYYNQFLEILPASKVETLLKETKRLARKEMHARRAQHKKGATQELRE